MSKRRAHPLIRPWSCGLGLKHKSHFAA